MERFTAFIMRLKNRLKKLFQHLDELMEIILGRLYWRFIKHSIFLLIFAYTASKLLVLKELIIVI